MSNHGRYTISIKGLSLCFRCDQQIVGDRCFGGGGSEEGSEGCVPGSAPVEAEDERVEVGLQVFAPQTVGDAERPGFRLEKTQWSQGSPIWATIGPMTWGSWVMSSLALEFEQGSGKRAHDWAPGPAHVHSIFYTIPSDLSLHDAVPESRG